MRYAGVLGTVALTEVTAHFLSLGWGLMTLLAAFAWVALSGATVAAKARSTEDRLNALIPAVGTAYSTATAANTLAGNALPKSGGTVTGSLTVNGNHTVGGPVTASGATVTAGVEASSMHATSNVQIDGDLNIQGSQLNMQQSAGGFPVNA